MFCFLIYKTLMIRKLMVLVLVPHLPWKASLAAAGEMESLKLLRFNQFKCPIKCRILSLFWETIALVAIVWFPMVCS